MAIDGNKSEDKVGVKGNRKGSNENWPGCTKEFVNRTEKRRSKNKEAKKSRKKNRNKK